MNCCKQSGLSVEICTITCNRATFSRINCCGYNILFIAGDNDIDTNRDCIILIRVNSIYLEIIAACRIYINIGIGFRSVSLVIYRNHVTCKTFLCRSIPCQSDLAVTCCAGNEICDRFKTNVCGSGNRY